MQYPRALATVALLNAGFGIVEMAGGLAAGSQALKADALDFLGDGAITTLALLALRYGPRWRARSALLQGWFLALLGVAVLADTLRRAAAGGAPAAEAMGVLGLAGLAVNLAAAAVLIPHRQGDISARTVWLFSRNDALANVAVIAAAALVRLTGRPWPDLVVGAAIAALFLRSASAIIRRARGELRR